MNKPAILDIHPLQAHKSALRCDGGRALVDLPLESHPTPLQAALP